MVDWWIMSIYQGCIALLILFFICFFLSFRKEKSKRRTIARVISIVLAITFVMAFFSLRDEFLSINKCKQEYQGFYTNNDLCYGSINVTHDYLENNGINVSGVMNVTENLAVVKTTDGRTLIVTKSPDGFSVHP